MYQNIDDTEAGNSADGQAGPAPEANRTPIFIAIAIGIALLVFVTVMSGDKSGDPSEAEVLKIQARTDFMAAISAPDAALRRARLTDFIDTYPKHTNRPVALAQLSVLNAAEASDWAEITNIFYNPAFDPVQKLIAVDEYESRWGSNLIGGRQDEIKRIREMLTPDDPAEAPDETETDDPDFTPQDKANFAETVPSDVMAGGVVTITRGTYARPQIIEPRPRDQITKIVDPEIRRNVTPRYPSKALRRNVGAVVTLSLYIDDDGDVEMTELVSFSGDRYRRDFVRAAERAALRTRFHPKRINGRAVPASGVIRRYVFDPDN